MSPLPLLIKVKKYGYVFYNCKLTAEPEATKVYLSRPWRPYAQAVFIRCELGKHILPLAGTTGARRKTRKLSFMPNMKVGAKGAHPKARAAFSPTIEESERI